MALSLCQCLQVFNRAGLAAAWAHDPHFLKQQVALWVQRKQMPALEVLWPQLIQQAATTAAGAGSPVAGSRVSIAAAKDQKKEKAKAVSSQRSYMTCGTNNKMCICAGSRRRQVHAMFVHTALCICNAYKPGTDFN